MLTSYFSKSSLRGTKQSIYCICLLSIFFSYTSANAQPKIIAKIDTIAKAIYVDNLDNIYLLTPKDELLKYDNFGKLKWRYSNNRYGKVQSIDVSDPLRVVLFFGDFQQVVVLNNNLSELTNYSFLRNGTLQISALASSNNNGFWAFDRASNSLLKLSSNFTEDMRSTSFLQLFDEVIVPKKLVAGDQFVYLQTQKNNVLQFDRFAAFIKAMPIDSLSDFNITSGQIAYLQRQQLVTYDPINMTTIAVKLNVGEPIKQVAIGNKIIIALTEKAVFLLSK